MTRFNLLNFPCLLSGAIKGDLGRDWHGQTVYGPNLDHRLKRQGVWLDYILSWGATSPYTLPVPHRAKPDLQLVTYYYYVEDTYE
jgi:hypothetical protein